jgi:hypothetical protein
MKPTLKLNSTLVRFRFGCIGSGHRCKNASEPTPVECKTHGLPKTRTRTVIHTNDSIAYNYEA